MKSLLLVAHGSRVKEANDEIVQLTEQIAEATGSSFGAVMSANLEITGPTIYEQVDRLVEAGSLKIVVFPYFLASGRHVKRDIPEIIEEVAHKYPRVRFEIAPYLGSLPDLKNIILDGICDSEENILSD